MSLGARLSGWALRALGVLLVASAVSVAAFKAPDRPLESLVARWAPPPSQFIELPLPSGTQLTHLRDEGPRTDPLPILLLHGTSDSLHTWDGWTQDLSKTRRVLRVDLPGFGLTGPAASGDYGIRHYLSELVVTPLSPLIGRSIDASLLQHTFDVRVLALIRDGDRRSLP
ncbi:MAG: hypothetical protein ACK520_07770, partial [Inhella sp.]